MKKKYDMNMEEYLDFLIGLNACPDAVVWSKKYASPQEAWGKCDRGDWMVWLIGRCDKSEPYSDQRKPLVKVVLKCARLAWHLMLQKAKECIELHERWVNNENVSVAELKKVREATAAVAYTNADTAAIAVAVADAAANADPTIYAVAATYADANADPTIYAVARQNILQQVAEIIRNHYPNIEEVINP